MSEKSTIAALLTPPGRGAVAVIAVRGPNAEAYTSPFFRAANGKPVEAQAIGRIVYGRWGSETGEETLLTRFSVPVLTRFSVGNLEIHCHGGIAAPAAILGALEGAGCRLVDPSEILHSTVAGDFQRDAILALAHATTERTAAILLDQYRGALARAFAEIETTGRDVTCQADAMRQIDRLLAVADVGRHLTRPWRVVIAGQPNVGKSSLINALAGYDRAIVFDEPGTTRDALTVLTAIDGWPIELSDTAGIRETHDELESQAIDRARQLLTAAELVVLVFDLSQPWSPEDEDLWRRFPHAMVVHNKLDLVARPGPGNRPAGLQLSARTQAGLDDLIQEMSRRLTPVPSQPGEAVPFTEPQIERLHALRRRLSC